MIRHGAVHFIGARGGLWTRIGGAAAITSRTSRRLAQAEKRTLFVVAANGSCSSRCYSKTQPYDKRRELAPSENDDALREIVDDLQKDVVASSSRDAHAKTAMPAEDDALNDVVAELLQESPTTSSSSASPESSRSSREAKDASTGNERLLRQAASFASVKQIIAGCSHLNVAESSAFLTRLASLQLEENLPDCSIADWLRSIDYSAELVAALPNAENLSIATMVNAVHALAVLHVDDELRAHLLDEIQSRIDNQRGEEGAVRASALVRLLVAEKRHHLKVPEKLRAKVIDVVHTHINSLKLADVLLLLACMGISRDWASQLVARVDGFLNEMRAGQLVAVMNALAENGFRDTHVLMRIAARLCDLPASQLTFNQLLTLSSSMSRLSFRHPRLMQRLAGDLVVKIPELGGERWAKMAALCKCLAEFKFGSARVWSAIVAWMEENIVTASSEHVSALSACVVACAKCGVYPGSAGRLLAERANPSHYKKATVWLNVVHSLAIVGALTPRLAEAVLQAAFVEHILKEEEGGEGGGETRIVDPVSSFALKRTLLQVNAAARLEVPGYAGPLIDAKMLRIDEQKDALLALETKYGKKSELTEAFALHNAIYKLAPRGSYCLPPGLHEHVGCVLDAQLAIGGDGRFLPVEKWPELVAPASRGVGDAPSTFGAPQFRSNRNATPMQATRIAVVFMTSRHMTVPVDDRDQPQIMGQFAMNVRHLRRAGWVVVVIRAKDLGAHANLPAKVDFIKRTIDGAVAEHARTRR